MRWKVTTFFQRSQYELFITFLITLFKNKYMIYTIFGYTKVFSVNHVKREVLMWKSQIHNTQTHYILNKLMNKIKNTSFRHTSVFLSLNKILIWINKKRNRSPPGTVTALFLSWKNDSISEKWSSIQSRCSKHLLMGQRKLIQMCMSIIC